MYLEDYRFLKHCSDYFRTGVLSQEHPFFLQVMETEAAHALLQLRIWKCHNQRH
jgi:hypothetical protein